MRQDPYVFAGRTWQVRSGRGASDRQVIEENWRGDTYRLGGGPLDLVIDLGANIGAFALRALDMGASHVLCYEPDPANSLLFSHHCHEEVDDGRIEIYPRAVWDESGAKVGLNPMMGGSVTFSTAEGWIPTINLNEILQKYERVSYLKIDIEGAEERVLVATSVELLSKVERLGMEYHFRMSPFWAVMVSHLEEVFTLDVVPNVPGHGGMIFGTRK